MAEKKSTEKSYKSRKPAATPAKKTTTQTTKKTVTKTPVDKEKELAKKKKEQEAIERVLANAEAKKKTTSTKKKTTTTTKKTTKSSTTAKATSSRKPATAKTATKTTTTKQKEVKQVVEPKVSQTKVEAKSKVTEKKKVEEKKVETTNLDDLQKKIKEEKSKLDKKIEKKILDDVIANAVQKEVQEDIKPREIDTELIKDMVPRTEPISTKPQDESIRRRRTVTEDEYKEIILSSIAAAEKEIEEPVEEEKVQEEQIEEDVEHVMDDTGIIPIVGETEEHPPVKIHYHNEDVDFDETIQLEEPITEEFTSEEEKEDEVIEQLEVEDEVIEQLEVEKEEKVEEEKEEVIETKVKEPKLKHKKKGKKLTNAISIIMGLIFIISTGLVYGLIQYLDVLPAKYSILFTVLTVLYTLIVGFMLLNVKVKKGIKIFFIVLALISTAVCTAISYFGLETLEFFKKVSEVDHSVTEKYYVMVKKDSKYTKLEDIENISLATFNENTNVYKQAVEKLNDLVETTLVTTESSFESIEWLLEDEISVILLSNIHKEAYEDEHKDFKDQVKTLHTIEVKTNGLEEEVVTIKPVSEDIMTIYISGIDTYGSINLRSRSDVNMLVTVNKKNHEILLTSIPRDYYVPLHTYGRNDKLTHAGIYGVNESIQTVQDFMGIDINYYVRVNFSTLEYVVNSIGGVDVYSDKAFVPHTNRSLYIRQGWVHMDGKTALAFARERYAYTEGDRHRVQNQQDVLKAIINKVTSNPTILTRYSSILSGLSAYFQTNVDMNEVSDIVKIQLDKMPSWTIKQYSLDGTGSSQPTYSMGNTPLYVMVPNLETIETGSKYINGMAKGKTFAELGLN